MDIEKLISQNPWWEEKDAIKDDVKVKKVLETEAKITFDLNEENQVLIGPKQLGKTTTIKYDIYKRVFKQGIDPHTLLYYSFDTTRKFEEIEDVLNTFVKDDSKKIVYLDEVSFVNEWQRAIKKFLDSSKSLNVTLYVTGSSSINLKKELMPGRSIKFLEFLPLSFRKFLLSFGSISLVKAINTKSSKNLNEVIKLADNLVPYFNEIENLFNIYLHTGGYPDAIFSYFKNNRIEDDLYDIHWNAFISDISKDNKSIDIATMVVYGIIESYASKINLSSIARAQGIKSHITVRDYIESLENLFVLKGIFPLAEKRYVFRKERKVYFTDPFLYNMFARKLNIIDKEHESKAVEGIVYNALYRFINIDKEIGEPKIKIGFYSGAKEVDFVIGDYGFEVKWQNKAHASDFPKISIRNKILLTKKIFEENNDQRVKCIPIPIFLAVL